MLENRVDDDAARSGGGACADGAGAGGADADGCNAPGTAAELLAAVVSADRMINAMMAMRAGLIETLRASALDPDVVVDTPGDEAVEWELRSVTAELACALRLPNVTAATLMDTAHVLTTALPATAAALAEGSITYRHAQTMVTSIADLDPHQRTRAEATLVPRAKVLTVSAFTRAANRERDHLDPVPLVERHAQAATGRTVLLETDTDGMAWLHAHLPATIATAIFHRLSDAAATLTHPDDPRTLPQLRADTLTALLLDDDARDALNYALRTEARKDPSTPGCQGPGRERCRCTDAGSTPSTDPGCASTGCNAEESGSGGCADHADDDATSGPEETPEAARGRLLRRTLRGIRPTVSVTVPVLTLLGGDEPAELEGYGPIDPDTARQLCAAAPSFLRILTHPHTGTILGIDRDRYTVPADLKSWLRLRDQTCRFPGCATRAQHCDIDHITDWAHAGTTDHTNLIHLCRAHHRLKHLTTWTPHIVTPDPPQPARPPDEAGSLHDPGTPAGRRGAPAQRNAAAPSRSGVPTSSTGALGASVRWTAPSGLTYTTADAFTGRSTGGGPGDRAPGGAPPDASVPPPAQSAEADEPVNPGGRARFPDTPPF